MIRIIGSLPRKVTVACSGGVDSMAMVNFLLEGRRKVELAFFNHDTLNSRLSEEFLTEFAENNKLPLIVGRVSGTRNKRSLEEFWRDERYKFFNSIDSSFITTCHHLDDCVETWIMSALHGNPKLIPYKRGSNIFRPFLMTEKKSIRKYACSRNLHWVEDQSNLNTAFVRNHIRHNLMPMALKVNPGIRTTIRKKLLDLYKEI